MKSTREELELLPECPFYIRESPRRVVCEGLVEGSTLCLNFNRRARMGAFHRAYCCSMDYSKCPIAKVLFAKYEEEECYG